ncbi:MAG: hypothetical protein IJ875_02705 [Solobacterium sp.]|nr:hypothetical protein [Solobacterium sp.]
MNNMPLGILLWVVLIIAVVGVFGYGKLMQMRIKKEGIETIGEISRIEEDYDSDTMISHYNWYADYIDETGQKRTALLHKSPELAVGEKVRLKFHPKNHNYAEFIEHLY